jgi:prephenate dehydrogenase
MSSDSLNPSPSLPHTAGKDPLAPPCPFTHLSVFGLGLIGGSFTMAVRQAFPHLHIRAIDPDAATLQLALRQNVVDSVSLQAVNSFEGEHLVILASHLDVNLRLLEQLAPWVQGKPVTVMDLGSCKRRIVELGTHLLPDQFLGAHPMAGREVAGLQHATPLLFAGKRFLLTPHPSHPSTGVVTLLSQFVEGLGSRPSVIDSETHDRMMAYVSHFPQLYSILLTNVIAMHEPGRLLSYHGGGIDDQLRLAASSYAMWGPIFSENADNLRGVLDEMLTQLQAMREGLEAPEAMQGWFNTSNTIHKAFHQLKHG